MSGERVTKAWERYERGRAYNSRLVPNQYDLVNTNIEFFAGNQWLHLADTPAMRKLPKPTFNIIKRVASLFVASLTSSAASISFDELSHYRAGPVGSSSGSVTGELSVALPPAGHQWIRPDSPTAVPGQLPGATRGTGDSRDAARSGAQASAKQTLAQGDVCQWHTSIADRGEAETEFISPEHKNLRGPHSAEPNGAEVATAEVQNLLEKFKMDYRIREALFDGAQTGDYCAHFWWDPEAVPYGGAFGDCRGEIHMELVDGINVMFGNPNTPDVERQPYILIVGRDTVEELKKEAALWQTQGGVQEDDFENGVLRDIQPDADLAFQAGIGGRTELDADGEDGKALYLYMYEKKSREEPDPATGEPRTVTTVHVTKATRSCVIYEDVDTGLSRYPIAWGNWEKQKNQYHGRALVTGIIPNQIFINTMFAMVMRHLQLMGFPKTVYNADLIGSWTNEVGQAIAVRGLQPGQSVGQMAAHLQPADMSAQIFAAIDRAVAYTKDCLGATDAQLGNVRPDNTSALMVLQQSAEVPLENTRAGLYEWLEDIGAILLDMMGTYYGRRPMVRERSFEELVTGPGGAPALDPETGTMLTRTVRRRVTEEFDFSVFKNLWFNVRVNAGASTYFSEIAMVQTLDNLRRDGALELIDYLERVPDKLVPRKAELVQRLRERAEKDAAPKAAPGAVTGLLSGVPKSASSVQARRDRLPAAARRYLPTAGN